MTNSRSRFELVCASRSEIPTGSGSQASDSRRAVIGDSRWAKEGERLNLRPRPAHASLLHYPCFPAHLDMLLRPSRAGRAGL